VLIELTSSGRRASATIQRTFADLERRALGNIPDESLDGFHEVLRALTERLG
jgi:DNA-binding MarR family transcriptional regulator